MLRGYDIGGVEIVSYFQGYKYGMNEYLLAVKDNKCLYIVFTFHFHLFHTELSYAMLLQVTVQSDDKDEPRVLVIPAQCE
jgi:hypothetical protein